jgi:hypothetical protein
MAQIYDHQTQELHQLLNDAAKHSGATLVIPDLQRPYVWKPNQVSLLVDSLIRGWPFGTLLLWKVEHDQKRNIPSRAFWQVVVRNGSGDDGQALQQGQPPASYQMVLDGQQRLQSLLLATHGDNWGFKLTDKDWGVEVGTKSAKGKANKQHWSQGSLCLDLSKFLQGYQVAGDQISAVEYDKILVWAVTDQAEGKSKTKTSPHYKRPLVDRFSDDNKSSLIRFSRLWDVAGTNQNLKEKNYAESVTKMLADHGVAEDQRAAYLTPLSELMTTLRDVKLQKVAYLELRAFDKDTMDRDSYDDAIVNIFTRLNTAGRTLSREEITFAWLKSGWQKENTSQRIAQQCFEELQDELKSNGLALGMDDLVAAVSFIWSVVHNQGKVLTNRDLLQGDIIRPMGVTLSKEWDLLAASMIATAEIVNERELIAGKIISSTNALVVFWAAAFQFKRRAGAVVKGKLDQDSVIKIAEKLAHSYLDRWLAASTWAQKWAISSAKVLPGYAQALASDEATHAAAGSISAAEAVYKARLDALMESVTTDAEDHINNRLGVEDRRQVSQYFGPLWLWHRLTSERWNASNKQLQIGKAKTDIDVDHVVSIKIWDKRGIPVESLTEGESAGSVINSLGNCALLCKSFNIIKSGDPLRTFMCKVHEFKNAPQDVDPWASKLGVSKFMLDGATSEVTQIISDVRTRDEAVRSDLVKFIRGEIHRADMAAPTP